MKRFFAIMLCLGILLGMTACSGGQTEPTEPSDTAPSSEPEESKGIAFPSAPSVGLEYEVNDDGITCTITGLGDCTDTILVIGEEIDGYQVVAIGEYAFYRCKELQGIQLCDSITSIQRFAFYECTSLEEAVLSGSLVAIEQYAFAFCSKLKSVAFPDTLERVAGWAYYYCPSLEGVYLSDMDFWFHVQFEGIYANPLRYAADLYVNEELLTEVVIPEDVTEIGDWLFESCMSIEHLVIHENVTSIGERAFRACKNLTVIDYSGTKDSWKLIAKDSYWNISMANHVINCTDGMIKE